ncbi:perlucin-like, partial [Ceratina calcarata]|uniref:Perlucin-like n=1 Tax=Ceratina calcarata TaxID=156304 RepID=A0AAJ7RZM7_9HYME
INIINKRVLLCFTGISAAVAHPYNVSINPAVTSRSRIGRQNEAVKRYACPIGFFRLKRYCYYLSGGTAPWREAYFHCKDRNATLAILDRNGKDRMLRKYLSSDQFTKLERWIGGIFNWQQMAWEWGVTGQKMVFQNFGLPQSNHSKQQYAWHCVTIDPTLKYKWSPRSCVERKHYVCEVQAGRIPRRRKKTADPFAPQNQRLKHQKKGKKYSKDTQKPNKQKKQRGWRRNFAEQNMNDYWVHGVKLGSRPPTK